MVAHNDVNELYAVGAFHYPFLKPHLENAAKTAPVKLLFGHEGPNVSRSDDWTSQSDHYSFHQAKIPFVYFGVEDHKDYHRPTDDFVNINQAFYVRAVETILAAVKAFDANLSQIEKQKAGLR
jgi:Zn-dependent M28 family amino/carboxypeptidase